MYTCMWTSFQTRMHVSMHTSYTNILKKLQALARAQSHAHSDTLRTSTLLSTHTRTRALAHTHPNSNKHRVSVWAFYPRGPTSKPASPTLQPVSILKKIKPSTKSENRVSNNGIFSQQALHGKCRYGTRLATGNKGGNILNMWAEDRDGGE